MQHSAITPDKILVLLFFIVTTVGCNFYGYAIRPYIFLDILLAFFSFALSILIFFIALVRIRSIEKRLIFLSLFFGLMQLNIAAFLNVEFNSDLLQTLSIGVFFLCFAIFLVLGVNYYIVKKRYQEVMLGKQLMGFVRNTFETFLQLFPVFLMFFAYCSLKSIIPILNDTSYDQFFWQVDRFLFAGHSPHEFLFKYMSPALIPSLSAAYVFYFLLKFVSVACVFAKATSIRFSQALLFNKMLFCLCLVHICGLIIYLLFPAQGPIYAFPAEFEFLQQNGFEDTLVYNLQQSLAGAYQQVLALPPEEFVDATLGSGVRNGIAAFPSLHIAVSLVCLYFLYQANKLLCLLCIPPFLLMSVATVYFAWHYLVDDLAGVLLAIFCIVLSEKLWRLSMR